MAKHIRGTGRVFQRTGSQSWWIAYCHDGREYRESAHTPDRRAAETLLREKLRTAGTPAFQAPRTHRIRLQDLADVYLRNYRERNRRSLRSAERIAKRLVQAFDNCPADRVTTTSVRAYIEHRLGAKAAPASVNRELAALKRMFSLAVKSENDTVRLTHRPYIPMLDESDNVREGFVEPAEFAALCATLPADVADLVAFAYHTAWRRAEVVGLEWARVSVERGLAGRIVRFQVSLGRSQTKNRRARTLAVLPGSALFGVLERRLATRHPACTAVFHRNGRPVRDFRGAWEKAREAAGLHGQLFHDLRRSAIRNMVRAGVTETVARTISGHRTRSVFDRYNVSDERDLEQAVLLTDAYTMERQSDRRVESLEERRRKAIGQNSDS